jgi:hypothetical protein
LRRCSPRSRRKDGIVVFLVLEESARRLGEQDLAAVSGSADPSRPVDRETVILITGD